MSELFKWIVQSGFGFDEVLILILLAYVLRREFRHEKERGAEIKEREERIVLMRDVYRRLGRIERLVRRSHYARR